jgi:hypothetical protein
MELRFRQTRSIPSIVLRICEGECSRPTISEISLKGNRITFLAEDHLVNSDGTPAASDFTRFSGTFGNSVLTLIGSKAYPRQRLVKQSGAADGPEKASTPSAVRRCY